MALRCDVDGRCGEAGESEAASLVPLMPCTVLIVEDEPLLRLFAVEVFAEAGFTVLEAASGEEAWRLLAGGRAIDALFTDVNMPGALDGFALAEAARRAWPHLAIVVASGRMPRPGTLPAEIAFLMKPYGAKAVTALMRRLVEKAREKQPGGRAAEKSCGEKSYSPALPG